MIITIKGADFSTKNIGTLSTWTILTNLGSGATYSGNRVVDKGGSLSATITIADGYELGSAGVSVIMGTTNVTSSVATVSGNTITISIATVTNNVTINVPTLDTTTGEEDGEEDILSGITLVHGNAFLASPTYDHNRLSSNINFGVDGTKKFSLKDPIKYNYALYDCPDETTQVGGVGSGWITDSRSYTNKWVGFCIKKVDESSFDLTTESNLLSDYVTVE